MPISVRKRNGEIVPYNPEKITAAIYKAAVSVGGDDYERAEYLTKDVERILDNKYGMAIVDIEDIQDCVEKSLIENGHAKTAKSFILYREQRKRGREDAALTGATIALFQSYTDDDSKDGWRRKENSNAANLSVANMNNFVRENLCTRLWLNDVYPEMIRRAHQNGDIHIHDLGFFGPYCAGWDLRQILMNGFGGVPGKVESRPPKHLRAFLGQILNSTFTTQGETAGAQAWSSFDTYCAPFVRYDNLSQKAVKQAMQEFIFNLNVPTRVGFQCPFSNLTFDIVPPRTLRDEAVIISGKLMPDRYGDFQKEMDMINQAFCDVMMEGDAHGRVFTFPIPTINVTKDFAWDSPVVDSIMSITCKYGIPYFSNYINSDLSPEDALSMCCRLRLDTKELRKRGGGLFGSNPLTGSIGVVTVNLPRLAYLAHSCGSQNEKDQEAEFYNKLGKIMDIAKDSLEMKRKTIEKYSNIGFYPYSTNFLKDVKMRTGEYWYNHFSTIGLVGMNECCLNLFGEDITTEKGQKFANAVMDYMRERVQQYQAETGRVYNLEATPAEGTSYSLANIDKQQYNDIITAGENVPYYTNSTQLPVNYTDDIFETLDLQDSLQCKYTGGTVLHLYLGEQIKDKEVAKNLIKKIFTNYKLPYISLTPTFSVCPEHGYITGEIYSCPECGKDTEVWSRVVGYLRPVQHYHKGKREEYRQRIKYVVK